MANTKKLDPAIGTSTDQLEDAASEGISAVEEIARLKADLAEAQVDAETAKAEAKEANDLVASTNEAAKEEIQTERIKMAAEVAVANKPKPPKGAPEFVLEDADEVRMLKNFCPRPGSADPSKLDKLGRLPMGAIVEINRKLAKKLAKKRIVSYDLTPEIIEDDDEDDDDY